MRIDVNAWVGHYPFRNVEGGAPLRLLDAMRRNRIDTAWVSHLSAVYWRDPTAGNETLFQIAASHPSLRPVPAVHPGLANREAVIRDAAARNVPAIRIDPLFYGVDPGGADLSATLALAGAAGLTVLMATKLEDGRQRHPNDGAADLTPAMLRRIIRSAPATRLIVTHADRDTIEQTVFGSTPEEIERVLWEMNWLWGPPADDLPHLVQTIGADRFCFGTAQPLRIAESAVAKLELLEITPDARAAIERGNASRFDSASPVG